MSSVSYTGFFGDAERTFALTPPMILELERVTGAGIGGIYQRLLRAEFRHADIVETIRLGLIGGGASPEEARALVDAYALTQPIVPLYPVALGIFDALWGGTASKEAAA